MSKIHDRVTELAAKTAKKKQAKRMERRKAVAEDELFGTRVRKARGMADKTLKESSEIIGCTPNYLGEIEKNHTKIDDRIAFLRAIVEAFGGTFVMRFPGEG